MGIPLFGINISGIVKSAMASGLPALKLRVKTPGTRSAGAITAGTNPKSTVHDCRGFSDSFGLSQINGTTVQRGDRRVLIIGDTLPTGIAPKPGDEVLIEGGYWRIVTDGVSRDPAAATYTCHVRNQ